jgi:LPXTG-site transpeptidase (sortase) family protein
MNIDNDNLTVLAGHNINLVFHKIHHLSKNDVVYIKSYKKVKEYKVIKKTIVNIDNYDLLFKKYNKDTLILITCTNNDLKRLIVICELVKIG